MPRILVLIILGWLLYKLIKRLATTANNSYNPSKKPEEKILQCVHCGCYVPVSEITQINNQTICNNPACQKVN